MDILVKVLSQTFKERSEYEVEILVIKDSEIVDLNLQVTYKNELIHLRFLEDYNLKDEQQRKQYESDIQYLNNWFDIIIMEERGK